MAYMASGSYVLYSMGKYIIANRATSMNDTQLFDEYGNGNLH